MPPDEDRRPDSRPPDPAPSSLSPAVLADRTVELAQIGGWSLDLDSMRLTWTPELRRILEVDDVYQPSAERMLDFCPPESRPVLAAALDAAMHQGTGFDLEVPIVTAAGRNLRVRVLARIEAHEGRPGRVTGVFQDVTACRNRDEARRRLELEVLEMEKAETLGTFAGGVAHDFNNLLTGIMGYHELIACELGENSTVQDYIAQARSACLRARDLLEQILTFARQTSAAPRAPLDLAATIEAVHRQLRLLLPAGVAIEAELSPDVPPVPANAAQIHLALLNLGMHAARAAEARGGTLFLRLRRTGPADSATAAFPNLPPGDYACVTVANTRQLTGGPTERRAFERSFTTGEMREDDGLGVAVVYRIIRAHRGVFGLERDPAVGDEFRIYLPFAALAAEPTPAAVRPALRGSGQKIFVVDDEDTVATFMRYALEAKGYDVALFDRPKKCLEALAAEPHGCDLLITDQAMPGLSGVELTIQARRIAAQLPVLIASGNYLELPPHLAVGGGIRILQKPFTTDQLVTAVDRTLHPPPANA